MAELPPLDVEAETAVMFDLASIPDDAILQKLEASCSRLAHVEDLIDRGEEALKRLKDERDSLARRVLPDLLDRANTDRFGVPGMDSDVVVEPVYHAAIKQDWPSERRDAAFEALERAGGGDLLRCVVSVEFGRGELERAMELAEMLRARNDLEGRPVSVGRSVLWQTLTAFVREQTEAGRPLPLETIGATVSRMAKIKRRPRRR